MSEPTIRAPAHDSAIARALADFCLRNVPDDVGRIEMESHPLWRSVREAGSDLWLDSGDVDANREVWTPEFSAFTTNNSLLNDEVQKGLYDQLVPRAADLIRRTDAAVDGDALVLEIAFVLNAVHGLHLARTFGAHVSVELHTDLTRDADASYEYGRRFHAICPERFYVKIALTPEGLLAARRLEQDGVPVNFTLGFSPRQNHLIARFAGPHFVNVFLGRVNSLIESSEVDRPLGELAALQSQRVVRGLREDGLIPPHTRQIAASMREGSQVAALSGIDVLTMPVDVARSFAESGAAVVSDRTREDPVADLDELAGAPDERVFWDVGTASLAAAAALDARDPDALTGDRIRAILRDCSLGDLFPELDEAERRRIADDGKLPDRAAWEERVKDGTASWDGLLTESALAAFAASQRELDQRIRDGL